MIPTKKQIEAVYALSPMQQGILFHSWLNPEGGVYLNHNVYRLRGYLNRVNFERAWQKVVERHSMLRTAFPRVGRMAQVVAREANLCMEWLDLRMLDKAAQQVRLDAYLEQDRRRGFDLTRAPLMRVAVMQLTDDTCDLVWTYHLALFDGWSSALVLREISSYYLAFQRGEKLSLPAPRPYRDYISWLQKQSANAAEAFWRKTLEGVTRPTLLA